MNNFTHNIDVISAAISCDAPETAEAVLSPRKLPRQQRSRTTVEAVLTAAEMLLARGGPFTTNHIAQRAGVSVGSLYQYFPNKQAIVAALEERRTSHDSLSLSA